MPVSEQSASAFPDRSPDVDRDTIDESKPIPARYWWLKRAFSTLGGSVLALVLLRLGLGWYSHWQFEAEVAKLAAASGSVWPSEEDSGRLLEAGGLVVLLDNAAAAANLTNADNDVLWGLETGGLTPEAAEPELGALVQRNSEALRLARAAAKRDWLRSTERAVYPDDDLGPGWFAATLSVLYYLLPAAAAHEHGVGNDREAVEIMRDVLRLTDSLEVLPSEYALYSSYQSRGAMLLRMESQVATLAISNGGVARGSSASPDQLAALIEDLADRTHAERAWLRQTVFTVFQRGRLVRRLTRGEIVSPGFLVPVGVPTTWDRLMGIALSPMIETDGVRQLRSLGSYVEAAREGTFPQAMALCPSRRDAVEELGVWALMGYELPAFSSEDRFVTHFTRLAFRRMAAIALAVRWYEVDHGRRPDRLDELVPRYLRDIPLDPFTFPEQSIGYRPRATPPVLYSVGEDGVDDNGSFVVYERFYVGTAPDIVFFLDGDRLDQRGGIGGGGSDD